MRRQRLSTYATYPTKWLLFLFGWVACSVLKEPVLASVHRWWGHGGARDLLCGVIFASLYVGVVLWQEWRGRSGIEKSGRLGRGGILP